MLNLERTLAGLLRVAEQPLARTPRTASLPAPLQPGGSL
jgi:hypothetical protein